MEGIAAEARLRDRVVEHLKRVGHDSISGIARALLATGQAPVHRLTVAGYLQALADVGVLKEVERPPSKEYQLSRPEWSVHQRVWRHCRDLPRDPGERIRIAVSCLQELFGRPVFEAELRHAGMDGPFDVLERAVLPDEVRRQYRRLLERKVSPRIDVPQRDAMWRIRDGDPLRHHAVVLETLRRLLIEAAGAEHLVAERAPGPHQASLEELGA